MAAECAICHKSDGQLLCCSRYSNRVYCGAVCQKQDWTTHKANCQRQNYILKVDLLPRFITNLQITRTFSCPASAKFAEFHTAIQVAFGRANTHLYYFDVFNHSDDRGRDNVLSGPTPLFKITDPATLDDYDDSASTSDSFKLAPFKVLDDPKTKGKTIPYNYDFGDGWEHVIICIGRADPTSKFVCTGGEGYGDAEDVGGYSGWESLLEAYDAAQPTRKQKEEMSWYEQEASNKDPGGLKGEAKWNGIEKVSTEFWQSLQKATTAPASVNSTSNAPQSVLLISLEKESWLDEMYSQVLSALRSKATVTEVTHIASALLHLSNERAYSAVLSHFGTLAIVSGHPASLSFSPARIHSFFGDLGLLLLIMTALLSYSAKWLALVT